MRKYIYCGCQSKPNNQSKHRLDTRLTITLLKSLTLAPLIYFNQRPIFNPMRDSSLCLH